MDKVGATLDDLVPEQPERGRRFPSVVDGPALFRVLGLPRRPAPGAHDSSTQELARFLTGRLAKVANPYPGCLRPLQAAALKEAWECRGLAGFIKVGGGKMLTAYLMAAVLGAKSALYVAPGAMRKETLAEFAKYKRDWHGPAELEFLSYEELANPSGGEDFDDAGNVVRQTALERRRPDVLIFDEADALSALSNVSTRRVRSYLKKHPNTVVIALTGTPFKNSIKDAAHILEWALGEKSPLPRPSCDWEELQAWADYLDVRASSGVSTGVGSLMRFLTEVEASYFYATNDFKEKRQLVRKAMARHIYETAGVLSSQGDARLVDADGREVALEVLALQPEDECQETNTFFEAIRAGALPDGTLLADNLSKSRHATTAGLNYWSRYSPEPPKFWRDARNAWAGWCSKALQNNRRGIDSEARMVRAVRKGLYNDEGRLKAWEDAQRHYLETTGHEEPPTEVVWLSDQAVKLACRWLREHNGLVWVVGRELGERIADECGVSFYRDNGRDARKKHIKDAAPGVGAVASYQSNRRGRNLQGIWSKQLFLCAPCEQSLARMHRAGQKADVVQTWVYLGCYEHLRAFERARDDKAQFAGAMVLAEQKLDLADGHMPHLEELADRGGPRWSK